MKKKELGIKGEKLAADFLVQKGYQIIEKNFWSRRGEIDLIARENGDLVFIEVKSACRKSPVDPRYQITHSKKKHLEMVARYYLLTEVSEKSSCRFDIIAISNLEPKVSEAEPKPKVELIKNAFRVG